LRAKGFHNKFLKKLKWYLIITGLLLISLVILFEVQVVPFENKCILKQAKAVSNELINTSVSDVIDEMKLSYNDLAQINYSDNGDVKSITTVSSNINKIKSSVLLKVQKQLDKCDMYSFYLPLGTFTHLTAINNMGPDVEINFKLTGSVKCKIKSTFESAGLNQTIHHIYLVVTANIDVMTPSHTKEKIYKSDYEIAQTVIVGNIPSTYADINK
jgi:sporulation protein YunB